MLEFALYVLPDVPAASPAELVPVLADVSKAPAPSPGLGAPVAPGKIPASLPWS